MTKGRVTLLLESNRLVQAKVAGLLNYGYDRFQIAEMLGLNIGVVTQIMRDDNLKELGGEND
jgi:hypothetical protein